MRYELQARPLTHTQGIIVATTDYLKSDEPALMLLEEDSITDDLSSLRRWQIIYVERGDKLYEFPRDLGPATKTESFIIFSGGEDSVEQLIDMADEQREDKSLERILAAAGNNSKLIEEAADMFEQKRELIKRNSRTLSAQYERKLF